MPFPLFPPFLFLLLLLPYTHSQTPSIIPTPNPCPTLISALRLTNGLPTEGPVLYNLSDALLGSSRCVAIPITHIALLTLVSCLSSNLQAHRQGESFPIQRVESSASFAILRHQPQTRKALLLNDDEKAIVVGENARVFGISGHAFGFVDLKIVPTTNCRDSGRGGDICASRRKCGTCEGDGGAPLVMLDATGREVVIGLAKAVLRCGREEQGGDLFEGIAGYLEWIKSVVGGIDVGQLGNSELEGGGLDLEEGNEQEEAKTEEPENIPETETIQNVGFDIPGDNGWWVVLVVLLLALLCAVVAVVWWRFWGKRRERELMAQRSM